MLCTTIRTVPGALRALESSFRASETVDAWLARLESAAIDGPLEKARVSREREQMVKKRVEP